MRKLSVLLGVLIFLAGCGTMDLSDIAIRSQSGNQLSPEFVSAFDYLATSWDSYHTAKKEIRWADGKGYIPEDARDEITIALKTYKNIHNQAQKQVNRWYIAENRGVEPRTRQEMAMDALAGLAGQSDELWSMLSESSGGRIEGIDKYILDYAELIRTIHELRMEGQDG